MTSSVDVSSGPLMIDSPITRILKYCTVHIIMAAAVTCLLHDLGSFLAYLTGKMTAPY